MYPSHHPFLPYLSPQPIEIIKPITHLPVSLSIPISQIMPISPYPLDPCKSSIPIQPHPSNSFHLIPIFTLLILASSLYTSQCSISRLVQQIYHCHPLSWWFHGRSSKTQRDGVKVQVCPRYLYWRKNKSFMQRSSRCWSDLESRTSIVFIYAVMGVFIWRMRVWCKPCKHYSRQIDNPKIVISVLSTKHLFNS